MKSRLNEPPPGSPAGRLTKKRGSGILLHITSLPSPFGIGDLGPGAYRFVDFLRETGQSFWQILPLNPISPAPGYSPYDSSSAFAGNTFLLSSEMMAEEGLLKKEDILPIPDFPETSCDYPKVISYKEKLFEKAYLKFAGSRKNRRAYENFYSQNAFWLEDYAFFSVIGNHRRSRAWNRWPSGLKTRKPEALKKIRRQFPEEMEKIKFLQFLFSKQWFALRDYCRRKNVRVIGDIPIYVNYKSADVWARQELFKLDADGKPRFVAGVPPDYFSRTGQLWGYPVYDWNVHRRTGFDWWIGRMEHNLRLFDIVRIDHFRGLVAFWQVPASAKTAAKGRWIRGPAKQFFEALNDRLPPASILAEDLGTITPKVKSVLKEHGLPGMKVLQFAFAKDNPDHPYLPHTYERNCVVYTGTHDNNTVRGWFEEEASKKEKKRLAEYLQKDVTAESIHKDFIRMAMMSRADAAIFPLQDVLGLGKKARMNTPGTAGGNWRWRFREQQLDEKIREFLRETTRAGRRTA